MRTRSWSMPVLIGIALGASLGGIIAFVVARRSREDRALALPQVSWTDAVRLIGPTIALVRQLVAMAKREVSRTDGA